MSWESYLRISSKRGHIPLDKHFKNVFYKDGFGILKNIISYPETIPLGEKCGKWYPSKISFE